VLTEEEEGGGGRGGEEEEEEEEEDTHVQGGSNMTRTNCDLFTHK
jgi:hypothetical protein